MTQKQLSPRAGETLLFSEIPPFFRMCVNFMVAVGLEPCPHLAFSGTPINRKVIKPKAVVFCTQELLHRSRHMKTGVRYAVPSQANSACHRTHNSPHHTPNCVTRGYWYIPASHLLVSCSSVPEQQNRVPL